MSVDFENGCIESLKIKGKERVFAKAPLFSLRFRKENGEALHFNAFDAKICNAHAGEAVYSGFDGAGNVSVKVSLKCENGEAHWHLTVDTNAELAAEWVDFPNICLPPLRENSENGEGGEILFPYNEGAIVSDIKCREESVFSHKDPEYPSHGSYAVFPNMVCSQMLAYMWRDAGLYIGAHDAARGVKGIDFYEYEGGITMQLRHFCGTNFGESYEQNYPVVFAAFDGAWESAAEIYREWFSDSLPEKAKKISENKSLPDWYEDSPLVVSYPVRGTWDADEMKENALYPYTNALPLICELKEKIDARMLVLLMHWEGTAPWAPPYVWPPYGGEENFAKFADALHKEGDLLGVYCSGFGYTIQSNLVAEYNCAEKYEKGGLARGMCAGPDGEVAISRICPSQRSGYDICPASEIGEKILFEAYRPLFESGVDYAQILDQNHGGGQYFCYSREHGHPPVPGAWMTENMQKMLSSWNDAAPNMLFGCESAAAEPFVGNLLFSDNRFELNYRIGKAVPLYAYIYHEYLRNFMGNQVSCPFLPDSDTLPYRIAYSFAAGDCMTLVFAPDGSLMPNWGRPRHTIAPNKEKVITLVANLARFYKEKAKPFLFNGKMTACRGVECETVTFGKRDTDRVTVLPEILSSAWESADGRKARILVNPHEREITCTVDGKKTVLPALDAVIVE